MTIKNWCKNQKEIWLRDRARRKKHKALSRAIRKNDMDGLKVLLDAGAEPGLYGLNNYAGSPMDVCAAKGTVDMMKLLIAHGGRADGVIIDTGDDPMSGGPAGDRKSVLYRALEAGNDNVAAFLAKRPGVDLENSGHYYVAGRLKRDYPKPMDVADKTKTPQTYAILARHTAARLLEDAERIQNGPRAPQKQRKQRKLGP